MVHLTAPASPPPLTRTLAVAISLLLASGCGAVAAEIVSDDRTDVGTPFRPGLEVRPDFAAIADAASSVVDGLEAPLPVPEPVPEDARAATPTVRHGMLEIPSIGLHQPFFEGVTLTAIDNGPSHWPGTPMPGELGNLVIAGHRVTKTRPFYDLDRAAPGDELIFTMDTGERYVYTLDRIEIVPADAVHIVDQSYGYRATLFGCHPKGSKRQRIVGHFTLQTGPA